MLGRIFDGAGKPIDGLGDIETNISRDINSNPINPIARKYPRNYIHTGISTIDGLITLIRGQKIPIFSGSGLNHNELAERIIRQSNITDGGKFAIVFGLMGAEFETAEFFRKSFEERVNHFIEKQLNEGRQCYIVCPLVEENEEMNLKSVTELAEKLQKETFSQYRVEFLHGKMKPKEKDDIMLRFKNGEIDILISTTVIEVGVDVPNANIMVIENSERFGLAQLHQLRGRVGRGEYKSYCILKFEGKGKVVQERMKIMCQTNDGFVISEKDLELRGSGDFFGTAQHGIPEMKIANLFEDIDVLKTVQDLSMKIMNEDANLEKDENSKLRHLIKNRVAGRIEI